MFRSFIYLDEDKLYTYKRQIDGANAAQPKTMAQRKAGELSAVFKGLGVSASTETTVSGEFEKDISFDYDRFELSLEGLDGEDYFDFVVNPEYDYLTVPNMKLMRVCNNIIIPEAFDMVNMIHQFMPMLKGEIKTESYGEKEALESFLGNISADIPIVAECDSVIISGKLNTKYLREDYSMLEDYSDQDVYMLCKVVGLTKRDTVEIFDPLKDFIRLPRAIRRNMEKEGKGIGLEKIKIEGPVLKVEVIAIYK